jgi:hypothetical protein
MFEGILGSLGYSKLTNKEKKILEIINGAYKNKHDVFIDYLKTINIQKIYIRDGKKTIDIIKLK